VRWSQEAAGKSHVGMEEAALHHLYLWKELTEVNGGARDGKTHASGNPDFIVVK